jgi:hypothetical protein
MFSKRGRAMDVNSGKDLDEACNHHNDVYSDEVLYASWAEAPRTALQAAAAPFAGAPPGATGVDVESFLARLYASQGQPGRAR